KNSPSASAHNSATTNRDQVQKAFASLDETKPTSDDISQIRDGVEDSKGAARSHNLKPQADGVPAETNAHPNNVAFRTDDDVKDRRKVTYDIQWMDKSDIKNDPTIGVWKSSYTSTTTSSPIPFNGRRALREQTRSSGQMLACTGPQSPTCSTT